MTAIDRRAFLSRSAAAAGGLAIAGPLQALAAGGAGGREANARGYGPLREARGGDLRLPEGFRYRVISRQGREMSDGNPTPGICDGMEAFPASGGRTILLRNHENRFPFFPDSQNEIPVVVPERFRYDRSGVFRAGVTKLVVSPDRRVERDFAILGGTSTNCAGGQTPWGSWITCEEFDLPGADAVLPPGVRPLQGVDLADVEPHGYIFEIDASAGGPVKAVPIKSAGRFYHEAVAWRSGRLYMTEDFDVLNPEEAVAFYRYTPDVRPRRVGDLARSGGKLEALRIRGRPDADLRSGVPVGEPMPVQWVTIDDPDPPASPFADRVHQQAFAKGAARFTREEGTAVDGPRIYFDCTNGGDAELGQIWEYHTGREELTLVYESPSQKELDFPDNLTLAPTGDLFICENGTPPDFIRGLTPEGRIFNFAQAVTNLTEFAGACFSADGKTLFVNQNGDRDDQPGVTYAIWGPFASRRRPDDGNGRPRDRRPRGDDRGGGGGSAGDAGNEGTGGGGVVTGGGEGTGTAGSGDLDPGAGADVSVALEDDGLPLTGLPLLTSAGAAAVLLATGAVLRRRLDNARARANAPEAGSPGAESAGEAESSGE